MDWSPNYYVARIINFVFIKLRKMKLGNLKSSKDLEYTNLGISEPSALSSATKFYFYKTK